MNHLLIKCILTPLLLCNVLIASAQLKGFEKNIALSKDTSTFQKIVNTFKGKPSSLIDSTNIAISRYMKSMASFEGKKINSIFIEQKHLYLSIRFPKLKKNSIIPVGF